MSLVFATDPARYVFLGDLDRSLHRHVVRDLAGRDPDVLLSAHHGTHFGAGMDSVRSRYVISSVGGALSGKVSPGYDAMGMHLRTDRAGDIAASLVADACAIWTSTPR